MNDKQQKIVRKKTKQYEIAWSSKSYCHLSTVLPLFSFDNYPLETNVDDNDDDNVENKIEQKNKKRSE